MQSHDDEDSGALRSRFGLLAILFTVCFVVLLGRLFYVQIVRGDEYRAAARTSFTTKERLPARRGEVKDRAGVVLAKNVPVRRLRIAPDKLLKPEVRNDVINRLVAVLELTNEEEAEVRDKLALAHESKRSEPIIVRDRLVDDQCPFDSATLELPPEPPPDADAEHLLFCRECGLYHEPIAADATFCPHDRSRLTWAGEGAQRSATCPKCKRHFATSAVCPVDGNMMTATQHNLVCPVCKRRFTNQVAVLESQGDLAGCHGRHDVHPRVHAALHAGALARLHQPRHARGPRREPGRLSPRWQARAAPASKPRSRRSSAASPARSSS